MKKFFTKALVALAIAASTITPAHAAQQDAPKVWEYVQSADDKSLFGCPTALINPLGRKVYRSNRDLGMWYTAKDGHVYCLKNVK